MLGKLKSKLDFSLKGAVLRPPSVTLLCDKKVLEKSQTYVGDGINDGDVFYTCIQILVVALSAIFSYVYLFEIIFSVGLQSCHSVDHRPTYQAFLKRRYLGLWSKWWVYQSFKKGLIIKHWQVTLPFLLISFIFCVFFLTGSPQNRTYMMGNVPFDLDL